jgi:hypothetical protein
MADWKDILGNAVGTGIAGWALSKVMIPNSDSSTILYGNLVNVSKGYGLIVAGASVISDLASDYILPAAIQNATLDMILQKAGTPLVSGAATIGLYWILNPSEIRQNGLMAFATGALANVGGSYINDSFLKPMWGR